MTSGTDTTGRLTSLDSKWTVVSGIIIIIIKVQTVKLVWPCAKDGPRKAPLKNCIMVPIWRTKKGMTSEFLDTRACNWNEKAGNWRLRMGRQRGVEEEN